MTHALAAPRGPPWRQKKRDHDVWRPPGNPRRESSSPRKPPGTLKARKPPFLILCPTPLEPSFEKHVVFENHKKKHVNMCVLASSTPLCIAKLGFQGPPWALKSRARFPQDLPERPRAPNTLPQDLPEGSCGPNMCPKTPQNAPPRLPSTSWDLRNEQGQPSKYHGNMSIWPPRIKKNMLFAFLQGP